MIFWGKNPKLLWSLYTVLLYYMIFKFSMHFLVPSTPPRSLMVNSITDSTMTFSWMTTLQPSGDVMQYDVQYRRAGTSSFANQTFTDLSGTVTGLTSNTAYEFRVAAVTVVGTGPYTTLINQRTGKLVITTFNAC